MTKLNSWKTACAVTLVFGATAAVSRAQFTTLVNFDQTNGAEPYFVTLVQGTDGNLYGTASNGGEHNNGGTVFKITPTGTLTTVYSFCALANCADGVLPASGLVLGTDGNFYGTTNEGGANNQGTVFKLTPAGVLTTLHSFSGPDGANPEGALVEATGGTFYGTTVQGGASGMGTIFQITPQGVLTTVHSFTGADGADPEGTLVQSGVGTFHGTTYEGGANDEGTVFNITSGGTLTYSSFDSTDGANPEAGLAGRFGTTQGGGVNGDGAIIKLGAGGTPSVIYSFCSQAGCADGTFPSGPLVLGTTGLYYGMTPEGGANGDGTIYSISSTGALTTLHSFDYFTDGSSPYGGLVQATNGTFYGTTYVDGEFGNGTVFSLNEGLGPFIRTVLTSGKVGAKVLILGSNLTGATKVTFNGTTATFTVSSATLISTTVPAGATTGKVKVVAPGGNLISNSNFTVVP